MREAKLGVAVGKKGVGKTYTTNILIEEYVRGNKTTGAIPRRVLIMDVNDEYVNIKALRLNDVRRFSVHPTIQARRIRPFKENGVRMTLKEIQQALFKILNEYRGGMLLIEDINRYISDSLPNDVIGAICTNRHTDTDIIMHFQSIGRISPKIWQNLNWMRFHKNTDSVDRHQQKFMDKYEYLKLAEILVDNKYYSGDQRYYLYVDIDEEKILGNITMPDVNKAIDEYIAIHYKSLVNPLLNQMTPNGEKKYTLQYAVEQTKNRILHNHFLRKP